MAITYEPIATTTLSGTATTITFSSIPSTYTDLRLVLFARSNGANDPYITFNGSSSSIYSRTSLVGDGTSASSDTTSTNQNFGFPGGRQPSPNIPYVIELDIFSYTGTHKKTCIYGVYLDKNGSGAVMKVVGTFDSTSTISSVTFGVGSNAFNTGTTATLYGILKA